MDFCLLTDEMPHRVPGTHYELRDPDYRHMVRFETAMLRAKTDWDTRLPIHTALAALFGAAIFCQMDVQQAFDGLFWFYRGGRQAPAGGASGCQPRALAYDYILDGPLIAAAFQQVYRIDLTNPATRIHWWRFQALMQGLPEGCQFTQVVGWRVADLSELKGKQLAFHKRMQQRFALPEDLGKGEKRVYASKADWDAAFIERLKRQAGKK